MEWPIDGKKTLKILYTRTHGRILETWYLELDTLVQPQVYSNDDPWVDLSLFYGDVKCREMLEYKISWKILKIFAYSVVFTSIWRRVSTRGLGHSLTFDRGLL